LPAFVALPAPLPAVPPGPFAPFTPEPEEPLAPVTPAFVWPPVPKGEDCDFEQPTDNASRQTSARIETPLSRDESSIL
jgi:hypothetical protein